MMGKLKPCALAVVLVLRFAEVACEASSTGIIGKLWHHGQETM